MEEIPSIITDEFGNEFEILIEQNEEKAEYVDLHVIYIIYF